MTGDDITDFLRGVLYDLSHPADAEIGWLLFKLLVIFLIAKFSYMVAQSLWQPFRHHWRRITGGWQSRATDRRTARAYRRDAPLRKAQEQERLQEQQRRQQEADDFAQSKTVADQQRRDAALAQIQDNLKID